MIEVELPDGTIAEFPDGTPNEVMQRAAQQYMAQAKQWQPKRRTPEMLSRQAAEYRDRNPVTDDMSGLSTFTAAAGKSVMDTGQGLKQLYASAADRIAPRAQTVGGLVSGQDSSRSAQIQQAVDERRATDDALMNTKAGIAGNTVGAGAQMFVPGTNAAKLVSYAGKGSTLLKGAAQAAPLAFVQPVATGESRLGNTAVNAGLGAVGAKIAPILSAAGSKAASAIRPEIRMVYEAAKKRGITLTPAQLSDSRFMKLIASQVQSLPGAGAASKTAQQRAMFNRRLAEAIGEPDAPKVTPEVYARAKARQSAQFEELTSRNELKVTAPLIARLEGAVKEAEMAGGDALAATRAAVENFYGRVTTGKGGLTVPGKSYQALDSSLGNITKTGSPVAPYVGEVKSAIREAMDNSISAKDRAAWQKLRTEYGNRKTIRDLVAKGDGGDLSPQQLMARVTANNFGKEAMATGRRGELGELARIGQAMKEPPSSMTAERLAAGEVFDPFKWPKLGLQTIAGSSVGRVANSDALSALMMRSGRGNTISGLARLVDKSQPQKFLPAAGIVTTNRKKKKDD